MNCHDVRNNPGNKRKEKPRGLDALQVDKMTKLTPVLSTGLK